jgi:hypothetical protein
VHRRKTFSVAQIAGCRPLDALFYTSTDWLRLATKLAENPSPCAQYDISIPPLAADKTAFRYDQPWRIRALGPQYHAVAEINYAGWGPWVTSNGGSWYAAGVEARKRIAAADFRLDLGDGWVLNELSSAVRRGDGTARQNVRDFVRGLYTGDGTLPTKGGVFVSGIGSPTADVSTYKARLQGWYKDTAFWNDMSAYVSDWSQELYGDYRNYAVPGATLAARSERLNDYFQHELALADAGPAEVASARSFLHATYDPLANAAWQWDTAFGWTNVAYTDMEDYVSAQTYALRAYAAANGQPADRFGFAWSPKNLAALTATDFNNQTGALLDRIAISIRDSGETGPSSACAPTWCTAGLAGSAFNDAWKSFATWSPAALGFASSAQALTAGSASAPVSVQLQTAGVADWDSADTTVTVSSSSAGGGFSTASTGPWTPTLSVTIPAGSTTASVYYRDTRAGSATLTASAPGRIGGTQPVTVAPAALASLSVGPSSASLVYGATRTFTATGADAYGNAVAVTPAWSVSSSALGTLAASGASATLTAGTTTTSGAVTATVGTLAASASVAVTAPKARVAAVAYSLDAYGRITVKTTVVDSGTGRGIANALVSIAVYRSGALYGTASGYTDAYGAFTVRTGTAPYGCYTTTIRGVTASGYAWDGVTPSNSFCK